MGKIEGRTRVFYPRNPRQKKIIEAIEEKEDTYTGLRNRLDMAKSTFNRNRGYLVKNNVIEKHQLGDDILYRLDEEFTDPIETTLRHLDSVTERSLLDLEKGRELLTKKIAENIVQISKYEYNSKKERFERVKPIEISLKTMKEKHPSEQTEKRLDELKFIKSIARYSIERAYFQEPELHAYEKYDSPRLLVEKLEEKMDDPHYFPAVGTIENQNSASKLEEGFDKLEEWIRPLRNTRGLTHHYYKREVEDHLYLIRRMLKRLIESSQKKKDKSNPRNKDPFSQ